MEGFSDEEFSIFISTTSCLLSVFAIAGNVFVITAHLKDPLKLFQTSSSQFIFNIAVVDLGASLITASLLIYEFVHGKLTMDIKQRLIFFPISLSYPSFFSLSVERFCCVAFPLWHRAKVTIRSCRICILGVWLFHITFETIYSFVQRSTGSDKEIIPGILRLAYVLFFFISTQAFYVATCVSLRKQNKQIIARQRGNENKNSSTRSDPAVTRAIQVRLLNEKRFLMTITAVCLILAISVFPAIIYYKFLPLFASDIIDLKYTGKIIILMLRINFTVNPFIYLWRLKNYQKTFKVFCSSCFRGE